MDIPFISKEQMTKIDSLMEKHFGIETMQMMENAGRNIAWLAREELGRLVGKHIVALVGKGNNGGDAAVAARFLHNWGGKVTAIVADHPDNIKDLTKIQIGVLRSMFVETLYSTDYPAIERTIKQCDFIIDGLLGYNLKGDPRGFYADLINMANDSGKKILSIDVPSGLDPDTGNAYNPCIKAALTLSLTLPKKGLKNKEKAGKVFVGDMGVPPELYELMEIKVDNIFEKKEVVKV